MNKTQQKINIGNKVGTFRQCIKQPLGCVILKTKRLSKTKVKQNFNSNLIAFFIHLKPLYSKLPKCLEE